MTALLSPSLSDAPRAKAQDRLVNPGERSRLMVSFDISYGPACSGNLVAN